MKAHPKITKADLDGSPKCPHCGDYLWEATVTVADLMQHYPFGGRLAIGDDGYAREDEHLTTNCPSCRKPVAMGFNSDPEGWYDWQTKFAAARTKKDEEFLNPEPVARLFNKAARIQEAVHCGEA